MEKTIEGRFRGGKNAKSILVLYLGREKIKDIPPFFTADLKLTNIKKRKKDFGNEKIIEEETSRKKVTHKSIESTYHYKKKVACGIIARYTDSSYLWKNVTCKRCIRMKNK